MENKLPFKETLVEACSMGVKNALSLICVAILYVLTVWIPYLNVGTTIAINSIPAELAKGNIINPLFIFDAKYRKNMGEFFIIVGLMLMAEIPAFFMGIIPALVLDIAWSLAILLFIDKGLTSLDALRKSNELTYGYKWRIFFLSLVLAVCIGLLQGIFSGICSAIDLKTLGTILSGIISILTVPFALSLEAIIYRELTSESIEAENAE